MTDQLHFLDAEIKLAVSRLGKTPFSQSLSAVLHYSEFASRVLGRNSRSIVELIESGELQRPYTESCLAQKIQAETADLESIPAFNSKIRLIRNTQMLRTMWREFAGVATVEESMRDLSSLADALIDATVAMHLQRLIEQFGEPISETGCESSSGISSFIVFAMGKLGGRELNFSSDIDLVFVYSEAGYTCAEKSISNNEFFLKLSRLVIDSLNASSVDGFVYRVDMRLRPNGQSGPLVLSVAAMENYYQIHGREWERYAWIKARAVAGNKALGADFLSHLRPFIYRKYLDFQVFDSLEEMKAMINKEIRQQGMENNIKLGRGGIREIEFIAQSHQLVRGGREPDLRTRSLKKALHGIARLNLIAQPVADQLYQAYLFLRRIEHRLQMKNDQQTHQLPESDADMGELAASVGLNRADLKHRLDETRGFVHGEFTRLHRQHELEKSNDDWQLLWQQVLAERDQPALSADQELVVAINAYASGKAYRVLEAKGRRSIDQLMPKVLHLVSETEHPVQSLNRVLEVISAIGGRTAYLSLLDQSPIACKQLIQLCTLSPWVSQWIAKHPIVLDTLINPRTDQYIFADNVLAQQLKHTIDRENDEELRHDMLRQIHHGSILQIAIADLQNQYQVLDVRHFISKTAEMIIKQIVSLCQRELNAKFGQPQSTTGEDYFAVIGYGKLGSRELTYGADLDLVFIYDDSVLREQTSGGQKSVRIDYYFSRLVQRIITMLNMQTAAGKLYDVDTRLRPSGQSGLLVSSISQYQKYQLEQAWTWEHQALVKARAISNAPLLQAKFEAIRRDVLMISRQPEELAKSIITMRERMRHNKPTADVFEFKNEYGGMIDIEFICQYLVLLYAAKHPQLCAQRSVAETLNQASQDGLINAADADLLKNTYTALLESENRYKLQLRLNENDKKRITGLIEQTHDYWNRLFS